MLRNDQKIAISGIERFIAHVLPSSEEQNAQAIFHRRVSSARNEMQAMHPVYILVEIEGVPS